MPYNPGVVDQSGQIAAAGITNSAQTLAKGIEDYGQIKEQNDFLTAGAEGLAKMTDPKTGQPLMDAETLKKFYSGSTGAKKGMYADALFRYKQGVEQQQHADTLGMEQQRINQQWSEIGQRYPAQPFQPALVPMKTADGRTFYAQTTSRNSAVPLHDAMPAAGSESIDPSQFPKVSINGQDVLLLPKSVKGVSPRGTTGQSALGAIDPRAQRIKDLENEIAGHQVELARGDKRTGFLNLYSRDEAIKDLNKQRDVLLQDIQKNPATAASVQPSAPPAMPKQNLNDPALIQAREAIQRGADRTKVEERLRQMGRDPSQL